MFGQLFRWMENVAHGEYLVFRDGRFWWQYNPLVNDWDSPWAARCREILAREGYSHDEEGE